MESACAILSSVNWPALPQFSRLSHKRDNFPKKKITEHKIVFRFCLQLFSETPLLLTIQRDIIMNAHWSSCKAPVILVRFQTNLNFLNTFSKKKNSNTKCLKNLCNGSRVIPCGDGQTDRQTSRSISCSAQFCERA